nr:unnamed protein product [Callosobruchus analis]
MWPHGKSISELKLKDIKSYLHSTSAADARFYTNLTGDESLQEDVDGYNNELDSKSEDEKGRRRWNIRHEVAYKAVAIVFWVKKSSNPHAELLRNIRSYEYSVREIVQTLDSFVTTPTMIEDRHRDSWNIVFRDVGAIQRLTPYT